MREDICYATTNRQMAVKNIAKSCDMFFVIGSRNSSNSVRLVEVAKKSGCENSQLIHSESSIPYDQIENCNTIGISSGASAPEILVENFLNDLKTRSYCGAPSVARDAASHSPQSPLPEPLSQGVRPSPQAPHRSQSYSSRFQGASL
jgi:4-hydroxy-3-methylbut-2-enyl diphosphate reductase IspH